MRRVGCRASLPCQDMGGVGSAREREAVRRPGRHEAAARGWIGALHYPVAQVRGTAGRGCAPHPQAGPTCPRSATFCRHPFLNQCAMNSLERNLGSSCRPPSPESSTTCRPSSSNQSQCRSNQTTDRTK